MIPLRQYVSVALVTARQVGGFFGPLLFLFALPGIIVLLVGDSTTPKTLAWLNAALWVSSVLLCAMGLTLSFMGLRSTLYFSLLLWWRRLRRR